MIKRDILNSLKQHLAKKEITLIVGPRQAGKTTIMRMLEGQLKATGASTIFLNLDREADRQFFDTQELLLKKIFLEHPRQDKTCYVFIDEIQRKENAGLFLKGIYDSGHNIKLIVSGSGSLELKENVHESLTGRKRIFEIQTLSLDEFVNFKTNYRYENNLAEFYALEQSAAKILLDEYLNFGGYPRMVLETDVREKRVLVDEIYHSVLERDIAALLRIEKLDAFSLLIKVLAAQNGKLLNYTELSKTIGIAHKTVQDYVWYAEKTFLMRRVTPFFKNVKKEVTKSPVVYFNDLGLRNHALGVLGAVHLPDEFGFLFQNSIGLKIVHALNYTAHSLYFWRSTDKAEVDFVIDNGRTMVPIEVKYRDCTGETTISRAFRSFIGKYQPKRAFFIHLGTEQHTVMVGTTPVVFLPFWADFSCMVS
jgi:uncharacterized protein